MDEEKQKRDKRNKLIRQIAGVVILIFGIVFVMPWKYTGFVFGMIADVFCQNVIDLRERNYSAYKKRCSYAVDYKVNDKDYKNSYVETTSINMPSRNKGEKIGINYVRKNPRDSIFDKNTRWIGGAALILLGLLMIVL